VVLNEEIEKIPPLDSEDFKISRIHFITAGLKKARHGCFSITSNPAGSP
jgi:hypothetical protein